MASHRILLLEDDASLGEVLMEHLKMQGFDVRLCVDGEQGLQAYLQDEFDLCLVDIMMPKKDGFTFAVEVRQENSDIPLIFLTAKSMKEDRIKGFKVGCDDYITKPFSIEELLLRIEAVMRRAKPSSERDTDGPISIGTYSLDMTRQVLAIGDREQRLTPKEAELLHLLSRNLNRTVTRSDALKQIWHDDGYFAGRSMDVFVSKLRKYLKDDPKVEILGIHGQGFRLVVGK